MAAEVYRPLGDVESVEATGDYTVEFKFKTMVAGRGLMGILGECPIVSQAAYEASDDKFASKPVTTSLYMVTEVVPGSSITFEKNAAYWQTDESLRASIAKANIDKIVFQIVEEAAQHSILLETGQIDISGSVAGTDIGRFEGNADFIVAKFLDNLTQVLLFNGSEGNPFTNVDLRQAVAYALDADSVGKGAAGENGYAVSHTIGNANFNGYLEKWNSEEYYTQDMAMAAGAVRGFRCHRWHDRQAADPERSQDHVDGSGHPVSARRISVSRWRSTSVEQATYNDLKADATAWDLALDQSAGGTEVYSPWALVYDADRYNGKTSNFFDDAELQALLKAAQNDPSEANLDAFVAYDKEQVYAYALFSYQANVVSVSGITEVARDQRGQIIPGACEYAADFK